jgi:hypothetical protein
MSRFLSDPTHGITTDPLTGRRYVLAYVELGRRAVEAMHRENEPRTGDKGDGEKDRSKRRAVAFRAKTAQARRSDRYVPSNTLSGTRWKEHIA